MIKIEIIDDVFIAAVFIKVSGDSSIVCSINKEGGKIEGEP